MEPECSESCTETKCSWRNELEHVQKPLIRRCATLGNTHRMLNTPRISSLARLV